MANFDLMHMTKLTFVPSICCFVEKRVMSFTPLLCICEENTATMRIFKAEGSSGQPLKQSSDLHSAPVSLVKFHS